MGIFALLLPLSRDQNRGGERAASADLGCGPGGFGGGRGEGKREREVRRPDPRLQPGRRRRCASSARVCVAGGEGGHRKAAVVLTSGRRGELRDRVERVRRVGRRLFRGAGKRGSMRRAR